MKKKVFGRQFRRDANERKALFKNLLTSLVINERIRTTEAKAKSIKGAADKLITKAKKGGSNAYRNIHPDVNQNAAEKLIKEIAPRFDKRSGGYTRIIKIAKNRVADGAKMVYLEWTERPIVVADSKKADAKTKKTVKKVTGKKSTKTQKSIPVAPKLTKKKEPQKNQGGFLKQLVSRQKKG